MHAFYGDILKRIDQAPLWFDENAVPRFDEFKPRLVADIYAREAALVEICCQRCRRTFNVSFSRGRYQEPSLASLIEEHDLFYGDPPNIGCCEYGTAMSSQTTKVLQYWHMFALDWHRIPKLEIDIENFGWGKDS